ncbi:MAG TPA: CDP-alcohol phosphatidyltransferase family protein [Candidatus Tectomicrobia bacterium]|nr:CDP-alcohol phosphatidyltransferase family protein [Candidatus Tectomicrobia bacterium]
MAPTVAQWRTDELLKALYLAAARGLTLARLASIPFFLALLIHAHREGLPLWRLSLLLLYVCIALSDVLDGRLARKAGAPSHAWGQVDAAADIAFTSLSLAAAAWLGYVGPWVPLGVAVLGGRFLLRNLGQQATRPGRLVEDRAGKAAGVIYYLLVGAVALDLAVEGANGRWWIARAGDAVFLYTLYLLLRQRSQRASPSAP